MKIVVGLGNPGKQYAGTRHNVGFDVVDEVALRLGLAGSPGDFDRLARTRFDGLALDGVLDGEKLLLLKPMTYMNDAGRSVLAAVAFYQAALGDLLVVLDDLALPCGQLRLRGDGSSGGHNGLRDIERVLGSDQYPRLRVGIDPAPPRIPGRDYVLQRFTPEQRDVLDGKAGTEGALRRAGACVLTWAGRGLATAMNQFNVSSKSPSKPDARATGGGGGARGGTKGETRGGTTKGENITPGGPVR